MQSPDSIRVLLKVRGQTEEIEERRLAVILKKLKLAQAELANASKELKGITATRFTEIHSILPGTHHQAVEVHSRLLWRRCTDHEQEIERLKELYTQQMLVYLSAHRAREVMESLNQQRMDARTAKRQLRERKLNEDLFLARRVAKQDT
jgi:hypothetical protein